MSAKKLEKRHTSPPNGEAASDKSRQVESENRFERVHSGTSRREFLRSMSVGVACLPLPFVAGRSTAGAASPADATEPIYLMNLDACRPQSALSTKAERHRWRLLKFECDVGQGTMLVAGQNTAAPEISYPLDRSGWYSIALGLRSAYGNTEIQVRLDDESTFTILTHRPDPAAENRIDDVFWKVAKLSGQAIVFRQLCIQTVPENPDSIGNACAARGLPISS